MRTSNAGVSREERAGYYNEAVVMFGLEPSVGPADPMLAGRMWDQPCEIFPAVPKWAVTAQEIDRIARTLTERHRQSLSELAEQ